MSGEDAMNDRPQRGSSSSLFTPGKMVGKGNNLASPLYFGKTSLDAGSIGDIGEGKYGEEWSLSALKAPVKLDPFSLLVLESVLVVRSLMLLFRDLPILDPGRTNAFLTLSHLLWEFSPFSFGVESVTITRKDSSHSWYSVFGEGSSG